MSGYVQGQLDGREAAQGTVDRLQRENADLRAVLVETAAFLASFARNQPVRMVEHERVAGRIFEALALAGAR